MFFYRGQLILNWYLTEHLDIQCGNYHDEHYNAEHVHDAQDCGLMPK